MGVDPLFVSQVAAEVGRRLGRTVSPREVTALFYDRVLPDELGPIVGGRRMISALAVSIIEQAFRDRKKRRDGKEVRGGGN